MAGANSGSVGRGKDMVLLRSKAIEELILNVDADAAAKYTAMSNDDLELEVRSTGLFEHLSVRNGRDFYYDDELVITDVVL